MGRDAPGHDNLSEADESLMRRFQAGDDEAFEVLFDRYSERLVNFAFRFVRSREEAEDVAQEVLCRVHGARDRYDASRAFRPWFFSIAARLVSNRLRATRRHPLISLFVRHDDDVPILDPPDDPAGRPESVAEKDRLGRAVRAALSRLPENQRFAVILSRYEEMSLEDISRTLGVSVPSVKSLLFRARQTLKTDLKPLI